MLAKKVGVFSSCKTTNKEKLFLSTAKLQLSATPKLTEVNKFHLRKPYCELAVQHPFFESQQSCVCCIASLSHRFKSSPAIPGKVAVFCVVGYMMNAGHFQLKSRIERRFESSPRVERAAALRVLPVLFVQAKRIKPFPYGRIEVLQTSIQLAQTTTFH